MSLTNISLTAVIKKLYTFKLKANIGVFSSLVIIQLLAILFSLGGVGMMGTGSNNVSISVHYYSANLVIIFTFLWAFITAILITTKAYRYDDFTFVTNRMSSNLANILFLLTLSIVGGLTAMLSSFLLRVVIYLFNSNQLVQGINLLDAPLEFLAGLFAAILYIFLFSALGYVVGMLVQVHKAFAILLPVVFFGTLKGFVGAQEILATVFQFFYNESSFALFLMKIMITAGLLYTSAIILSNRMEVRP